MSNDLAALERDIATIVEEVASPRATSRALAGIARETLAEMQRRNRSALGRVPQHTTRVDGRLGADERSVRADGQIVYEFQLLGDVLSTIAAMLEQHSPVLTGRYRASHQVVADGRDVTGQSLDAVSAAEVVFFNAQPYARKIERRLSPQAPEGVYQAVAVLAQQRFGNQARIRFTYRAPPSGGTARGRRAADARVPAIVVTPR